MKNTATCTEEGTRTLVCEKCGDKKEEIAPAKGHNVDLDAESTRVIVKKTCTTDGKAKGTCTECHEENIEAVIPASHEYKKAEGWKEATCTTDGLDSQICTICGATVYEVIPAKGHTAPKNDDGTENVDYYKVKPQTTNDKDGNSIYETDENGNIVYENMANNGVKIDTEEFKSMTKKEINEILCTMGIRKRYTCTDCQKPVGETIYDVKGHTYVTTEPTCTKSGEKVCSVCGNEEQLPATGHDFVGSGKIVRDGTTYALCNTCGELVAVNDELEVEKDTVETVITTEEPEDERETNVVERMKKVTIKQEGNIVTITQNGELDEDNIDNYDPTANCFGILLNLGIESQYVKILSPYYIFNPDGTDTNPEEMQRWGATAENKDKCFMIWLSPEDFKKNGGSYSITFTDSRDSLAYPITITFKYVKK